MKVLVIAPHPDDETLCCGGSIIRHVTRGDEVHVIVVTDGRYGAPKEELRGSKELVEMRMRELHRAVRRLGLTPNDVTFLGFEDAHVKYRVKEVTDALRDVVRDLNASLLYSPLPYDGHPDHSTVGKIVTGINVMTRFYLIWIPIGTRKVGLLPLRRWKRVKVNIEEYREKKVEALNEYRSQLGGLTRILERLTGKYETFYLRDTSTP
ncbi:PIG-L deacetylase family protein [Metallosphaera sedula]|uniref:LmbE family protein n=3 Tax=Metallosphaera TaxID=41980 RepID=A4YGB0_METS5|nr:MULTISPECIES: PIG-L family deacetylase [Metallosphaera]ABP95462.1 LmbE family protein [Metallosphaera sedula DSM 5348]AIM27447.1 LmbE family protein [Metallosphaera sedula]AKV74321.1 GlcNAc-PI de-N-acetylase [Metallosphaera sedula]AKV76560.1 GlcNAc-PI de-N-acetylase [Metallosphaera sedula]AKV78812.1 GlcNAc-PI de-N-acetylase [Metallosphaera sedula]